MTVEGLLLRAFALCVFLTAFLLGTILLIALSCFLTLCLFLTTLLPALQQVFFPALSVDFVAPDFAEVSFLTESLFSGFCAERLVPKAKTQAIAKMNFFIVFFNSYLVRQICMNGNHCSARKGSKTRENIHTRFYNTYICRHKVYTSL